MRRRRERNVGIVSTVGGFILGGFILVDKRWFARWYGGTVAKSKTEVV